MIDITNHWHNGRLGYPLWGESWQSSEHRPHLIGNSWLKLWYDPKQIEDLWLDFLALHWPCWYEGPAAGRCRLCRGYKTGARNDTDFPSTSNQKKFALFLSSFNKYLFDGCNAEMSLKSAEWPLESKFGVAEFSEGLALTYFQVKIERKPSKSCLNLVGWRAWKSLSGRIL